MTVRSFRERRIGAGGLSDSLRRQAAGAGLALHGHPGRNGAHMLEVQTTGMLGKLTLSRQNARELIRGLTAFEQWCEEQDDKPEAIYGRPPEKLVW